MSWVAFTREAVSRHEDWATALDHVAAEHHIDRAGFWFQDSSDGAWLFDGAPGLHFDPVARVFDPVQYQRARSRGDLEDVLSFFLHPDGNRRFHLTANRHPAPMTKTATKPKAEREDATPPDSITRTREQMDAIPMEAHKLSDPRKPAAVKGFEVDGVRYVATGGVSGGGNHGYYSIDACLLIEVDAVDQALVPKVRDHSCGRFFYYGQLVTIKGNFYALGADKLRVRRSDCRCKECTRLKLEANKDDPDSPAAVAAARRAKAGRFEAAVPIKRIDRSPWNPRKDFTSAAAVADLEGLAQSIREQGIIEPLIVRPTTPHHPEASMYELVAGERRWRAAQLAGLTTVPCIVRELDKLEAIRLQAVENLQRRDINPMEECEGYELLMREGKYTVADIARETGKSEASVYARLKLRDCPPGIAEALHEGRIPASTAELVARLEGEFKFAAMDAILWPQKGDAEDGADALSFRQAKAWIENKRACFEREAEWKKRAKESHAAGTVGKVLSAEESARELHVGGYVKNSQEYVKPTDTCHDDPKQRTYAVIAQEAGRKLPKPILARDPGEGKPVVLLPRGETLKVLDDLIPSAEEQRHRRAAAEAQRRIEAAEADRVRAQARVQRLTRAHLVVDRVREADWTPALEESFLRMLVRERFKPWTQYGYDLDDLCAALREHGVQLVKEDESHINAAWCEEYLDGTDTTRLRAWLAWFAVRDAESFEVEEESVAQTEAIFGACIANVCAR